MKAKKAFRAYFGSKNKPERSMRIPINNSDLKILIDNPRVKMVDKKKIVSEITGFILER